MITIFSVMLGRYRIFLMIILMAVVSTSSANCPTGCLGCQMQLLQCRRTGLIALPRDVPSNVKVIIIGNQLFHSLYLNQEMFRGYPENITQMSIVSTNIELIQSDTFSKFKKVRTLDLSANQLKDIQPFAFRGLNVETLRLENNKGLTLNDDTFKGLQVKKIILNGCDLKTITLSVFRPIMQSLKTLDLSRNRISTLDEDLSPLFNRLDRVELHSNPLNCNCKLLWLSRVMRSHQQYNSYRLNKNDYNYIYPTCKSPTDLLNRNLHLISENQFYCSPPQLQRVDVEFNSPESGTLTCSAEGPDDMNLSWNQEPQSTSFITTHQSKAAVTFKRSSLQSESDTYTCKAVAPTGSAIANIKVRWPRESVRPPIKVPINPENQNDQRLDYQNSRRESTDENSVRPPEEINSNTNDKSVFFRKQFTLMEMIGAVIGTFTITLAIFLIIYRCCIYNKEKRRKKTGYPTYETAYSDCQTYDLPQHPSYPPPPPPPNGPFFDFRTQRKLYNQV